MTHSVRAVIDSPANPSAPRPPGDLRLKIPGRLRIHGLETALLWLAGGHLVFLPWALGGMKAWAQFISLGWSALCFVLALLPRNFDDRSDGDVAFRLFTFPKLLRFPFFWLGLLFFSYTLLQTLNPSWVYETDGAGWWMRQFRTPGLLPDGVDVPFDMWGPWRMLMIYGSVWLTVCALWTGFTSRRSWQTLFFVLAGNGFLLACLGIAQRATGATQIFWLWEPPETYFVSSFIYKNHAGAYFNLMLVLCTGLAFWVHERSLRHLEKSSPAGLLVFFAGAVAFVIFFSYSRTSTLLMFFFLLVAIGLLIWQLFFRHGTEKPNLIMLAVIALGLGAFIRFSLVSLRTENFSSGFTDLRRVLDRVRPDARPLVALATWEMIQDRPVTGWGLGAYRFIFPAYQHRHPEIVIKHGRQMFFDHAHNDYLELLAEVGVIGVGILLAGFCTVVYRLTVLRFWQHTFALCVLLGCVMILLHSIVDFPFYNVAVIMTWFVLLFGTLRWLEIGEQSGRN